MHTHTRAHRRIH